MTLPQNVEFINDQTLGTYVLNHGSGHIFTLDLSNDSNIMFTAVQLPGRQDFSIELWISKEPWSVPVISRRPDKRSIFTLARISQKYVIYDYDVVPEDTMETKYFGLAPGKYYLNIQNKENAPNRYRIIF